MLEKVRGESRNDGSENQRSAFDLVGYNLHRRVVGARMGYCLADAVGPLLISPTGGPCCERLRGKKRTSKIAPGAKAEAASAARQSQG